MPEEAECAESNSKEEEAHIHPRKSQHRIEP